MSHFFQQTPYEILRFLVWVIGTPIIVFLVVRLVRQVRAIKALDTQLREEEARNAGNPYYQMSQLHEAQKLLEPGESRKPRREKR
ncbi:MAG: hypothetical protein H7Z41_05405 [Cytophagales bacterium]|nr:hypothetical protein [Armatimonadota bacterium]